ncbi:MAG: hypothetical protein EB101_04650, partial [Chitinophagia bacterium]|nr:hypothetical protein [Chitinophagia bacterium]
MDCLNFFEKQFQTPSKIINVSPTEPFRYDGNFVDSNSKKKFEMGPYNDSILEKRNDFGDKVSLIMSAPLIENDFNYVTF